MEELNTSLQPPRAGEGSTSQATVILESPLTFLASVRERDGSSSAMSISTSPTLSTASEAQLLQEEAAVPAEEAMDIASAPAVPADEPLDMTTPRQAPSVGHTHYGRHLLPWRVLLPCACRG